jgi:hypothetical protein
VGSTIRADLAPVTDLADDLAGQLMNRMLTDISTEVEDEALKAGKQATGGDLRLSRYGKGRRGGTRMTVVSKVSGKKATIDLEPAGMWALATGGAKPHYIGPGSRTRGGKQRRRHPGSRGKGSLDPLYAKVPEICTEVVEDALNEALG